jgi:hypothetical protein
MAARLVSADLGQNCRGKLRPARNDQLPQPRLCQPLVDQLTVMHRSSVPTAQRTQLLSTIRYVLGSPHTYTFTFSFNCAGQTVPSLLRPWGHNVLCSPTWTALLNLLPLRKLHSPEILTAQRTEFATHSRSTCAVKTECKTVRVWVPLMLSGEINAVWGGYRSHRYTVQQNAGFMNVRFSAYM